MKKHEFIKNFVKCGLCGWGFECFFTGCQSLLNKEKCLTCHTSIWMFPIYGLAACILPLCRRLKKCCLLLRGCIYTLAIFITEYITGTFLKKEHCCPWDYSKCKHNIKGVVRLDYAPFWFLVGLIYEHILTKSD